MSIFDNPKNKVKSNWFKFEIIGQKVEGTLVDKKIVMNTLKGAEQWVYELKSTTGEIWNIGGKPGIDIQMKHIKLGQIVGFEYIKDKPPTRPGFKPTKIIQVWADPNLIDTEWLKEHEEEIATKDELDEVNFNSTSKQDPAIESAVDKFSAELDAEQQNKPNEMVDDLKIKIYSLATQKLGATNERDAEQKIMKATGVAFIEENLPKIAELLDIMADKK